MTFFIMILLGWEGGDVVVPVGSGPGPGVGSAAHVAGWATPHPSAHVNGSPVFLHTQAVVSKRVPAAQHCVLTGIPAADC